MPYQSLVDQRAIEQGITDYGNAFDLSFDTNNPFIAYLEYVKTRVPPGVNIVGELLARLQAAWNAHDMPEFTQRLFAAPGDRLLNFGSEDVPAKIGLAIPIAYDIWYLFDAGNVLEFGGKSISETTGFLADYFKSIGDEKPLKQPQNHPQPIGGGGNTVGPVTGSTITGDTLGTFDYSVKIAPFETWFTGNSASYSSPGPKGGGEYAGYIAFPIGPLGVMWKISMASESALTNGGSGVYPVDAASATVAGGELLPPFDLNIPEAPGVGIMSKGYLKDDDTIVELFAEDFGGINNPPVHKWLRYWIKLENTEIIPGEFCGLLCRPWPLHCWWYQETAPFLYSGHWVETEFYTSGVVKEVIPPAENEIGNRYKVWVKNEEILVQSTDFYEYSVDERVGVLKAWRSGEGTTYNQVGPSTGSGQEPNFNWQNLKLLNTGAALTTEWVLLPVGFYEESGGSVGGT